MANKKKEAFNSGYFSWDKKAFISKKIDNNRNLDWFKHRYKRNLTIALVFSIITFLNASISVYSFKVKNEDIKTYITASSGEIIKYKMSDKKRAELKKSLVQINRGKNVK